jgi:hypothetical protein
MSGLVARILLAMLMLPAAGAVALVVFPQASMGNPHRTACGVTGIVTFLFVIAYWTLLWRRSVAWTQHRIVWTVIVATLCGLGGVATHYVFRSPYYLSSSDWIAPLATPLAWTILTTLLWRETPFERAQRLRATNKNAVVCPACGYNLTGLQSTRCPECGKLYTLDELFASQPSNQDQDVSDD